MTLKSPSDTEGLLSWTMHENDENCANFPYENLNFPCYNTLVGITFGPERSCERV